MLFRVVGRFWELSRLIDFTSLSDTLLGTEFCRGHMTDNPFVTVTIAANDTVKHVRDYLGCPWGAEVLRRLENAIDSVADSERWLTRK